MSRFGFGFIGASLTDTGDATASLSGTAANGNVMTATFNNNDPDGAATGITYQWFRDSATSIGGATASTYTLTSSDTGHTVRCQVSYTDAKGFAESITTANSGVVGTGTMSALTLRGDTQINAQSSGTFTFGGAAIGTAAADRWVFCIFWAKNATNRNLLTVSIGGVAASVELITGTLNQQEGLVGIAFAQVPTGTTASFVFTFDGTFTATTSNGMGLTWYTTNGPLNTTATEQYTQNANTNPAHTFSVPANGGFALVGGTPNNINRAVSGDFSADRNFVQYVAALSSWGGSAANATGAAVNKTFTATGWTNTVSIPAIGRAYGPA